ncbi:MAG: DMT family transporter [Anaerolineaceae bacterium]|nr:DMT family transporter [Anaerolineaceae bacterium]
MANSGNKKGFIAIAAGVALLGTGPIFVKSVHANGILVGFLRMAFAGLMLTIPAVRSWKTQPLRLNESGNKWWPLLGSLTYAVNIALWCTALNFTTASAVTLLDTTAPVWVGLFAWLFMGKKNGPWYWFGLAVTLTGAAMTVGFNSLGIGSVQFKGNMIALASGFSYAAYIIFTQRARRSMSSLSYSWLVAVVGAATLFVVSSLSGLLGAPLPLRSYILIALMAFTSQVVAWLLVNHALGVLPPAASSVALVGQPIVTTLLGALLINETISWLQALGGAICLAGILLVQFLSGKETPNPSEVIIIE